MKKEEIIKSLSWIIQNIRCSGNTTALLHCALLQPTIIIGTNYNSCNELSKEFEKIYKEKNWWRLKLNDSFFFKFLKIKIKVPEKAVLLPLEELISRRSANGIVGSKKVILLDNSVLIYLRKLIEEIITEERKLQTKKLKEKYDDAIKSNAAHF